MQNTPYQACCGAGIINSFQNDMNFTNTPALLATEFQALKTWILQAKTSRWGLLTGVTNPGQTKAAKMLYACGFRRKIVFANPNNGNATLKLWALDVNTIVPDTLNAIPLPTFEGS